MLLAHGCGQPPAPRRVPAAALAQPWRALARPWYSPGTALAHPWHSLGRALIQPWHSPGTGLARAWHEPGTPPAQHWHSPGTVLAQPLARPWYSPSIALVQPWHGPGTALAQPRHSPDTALARPWHGPGTALAPQPQPKEGSWAVWPQPMASKPPLPVASKPPLLQRSRWTGWEPSRAHTELCPARPDTELPVGRARARPDPGLLPCPEPPELQDRQICPSTGTQLGVRGCTGQRCHRHPHLTPSEGPVWTQQEHGLL